MQLAPVPGDLLADPQRGRGRGIPLEQLFKVSAAFDERQRPEIEVAVSEDVEGDERRRLFGRPQLWF